MEPKRKYKAIPITSVEEYVKKINEVCRNNPNDLESIDDVWFRGEPECYDYVLPSLYRINADDGSIDFVAYEKMLYDNALQYYPKLFEQCETPLDKLVTMQHFLLPTRLLDVTKNPLVALYFACEKGEETSRVLFTKRYTQSNWVVERLAMLLDQMGGWSDFHGITFSSVVEHLKYAYNKSISDIDKFTIYKNITKSHLFLPKYDNDRIKHQQGALIFSALFSADDKQLDEYNDSLLRAEPKRISESKGGISDDDMNKIGFYKKPLCLDELFADTIFTIDKERKGEIIRELNNYGVNEATVYPEPEHQMQYVKRYCISKKELYKKLNVR